MRSATELSKKLLGAVVLLTAGGGLAWLVYVGYQQGPTFSAQWTQWLPSVGQLIVGTIPLLASLIALRNRKVAAWLTLLLAGTLAVSWLWWLRTIPAFLEPPGEELSRPISVGVCLCFVCCWCQGCFGSSRETGRPPFLGRSRFDANLRFSSSVS